MGYLIRADKIDEKSRYVPPQSPSGIVPFNPAQRADEHFSRRTFDARCGYCAQVTRLLHSGDACRNCGARAWESLP